MSDLIQTIFAIFVILLLPYLAYLRGSNKRLRDENEFIKRQAAWRAELDQIRKHYVSNTDLDAAIKQSNDHYKDQREED